MYEGNDTFERKFNGEEYGNFIDYLQNKEAQTLWLSAALGDMDAMEIKVGDIDHPYDEVAKKMGLMRLSPEAVWSVADTSNAELSHVVVKARTTNGKRYSWLLSAGAWKDITDRYGARCPLYSKIPLEEQLKFLNLAKTYEAKKEVLVQMVDEKVWSAHGPNYKKLEPSKLIDALRVEVEKTGRVSFIGGTYSHNFTFCSWKIENDSLVDEYKRLAFEQTGNLKYDDFYGVICFNTSDVGESCATITPYISDGKMFINIGTSDKMKMKHAGDSSIAKWKDQLCPQIYASFKQSVEALKALYSVKIKHVENTAINIARDLDISQDALGSALADMTGAYDDGGTAGDVFMLLQEAIVEMEIAAAKRSGSSRSASVENKKEELARLLNKNFKWSEYDVSAIFANKKSKGRRAFRKNGGV